MARLAALLLALLLMPAAVAAAEDGGMAVPDSDAGAVTAPTPTPEPAPPAAVEPDAAPVPVEPEPVPEIVGPYGPNHVAAVEEVGSAAEPVQHRPPTAAVKAPEVTAVERPIPARSNSNPAADRRVSPDLSGASGLDRRPPAGQSSGPPWLLFAALAGALLALTAGLAARRAHSLHKFA